MNDRNNIKSDGENPKRSKLPFFLLAAVVTTFGVLVSLGLSFSAIKLIESSDTINTIISIIKGEDDKDKYIITYSENPNEGVNGINLTNQFPVPDSQGVLFEGPNYVYNFALILGGKIKGAYYEITAEELPINSLNPDYVKLYLEVNGSPSGFSYKNNHVKVYTDYLNSKNEEIKGRIIHSGIITKEDVKRGKIEFKLKMWISDQATYDSNFPNKTFGVRVNTYASMKG